MNLRPKTLASLVAACILGALTQQAVAQTPAPRQQPVAPLPPVAREAQSTSASFGDWVERCQAVPAQPGAAAIRVCEIALVIKTQQQNAPVAEMAIGRLKKTDPFKITLVLPVNVMFPSAPRITADAKDVNGLELTWRRCLPGGCFADAVLKDDQIARWRSTTAPGTILTKNSQGRDVSIPLSFRGMAEAFDALGREP